MAQRTNQIHARQYWNDTGVDLLEGRSYRLSVVPELGKTLKDANFVAGGIAGEDWNSLAHKTAEFLHGKRMDKAKWFALIGTIDKRLPWIITDGSIVTAPASGRLFCYVNDVSFEAFYQNNDGWVVLDVEPVE